MKRSPLKRFTALTSTRRLRRTRMATTRPSMSPEERQARKAVTARSGGLCEVHADDHPATDWSHRKRRSQGGPWCASNGLHVCRQAHQLIDDPTQPTPRYCAWHLDSHQDPLTVPVYLPRRRWVRLLADGSTEPCSPPDSTEAAA